MTNHLISDVQIGYLLRHGKLLLDQKEMLQSLPELTPQPLQPITADDVTDEMIDAYHKETEFAHYSKYSIAAAGNAYLKHRGDK